MICIQKIYGFHGLNHQIIEKSWDVTPVTDGRTNGRKVENRAVFCWTRNRNTLFYEIHIILSPDIVLANWRTTVIASHIIFPEIYSIFTTLGCINRLKSNHAINYLVFWNFSLSNIIGLNGGEASKGNATFLWHYIIFILSEKWCIHDHRHFWEQSLLGLKALYRGEKPDRLVGRLLLVLSQVTMGTTSWALACRLYQRT